MDASRVRSVIVVAAILGLLVSIFAAVEFFQASLRSVCSINAFFSCSAVDQSGQTLTFGIQDYLWGIGGFVAILVLAGLSDRWPNERVPALLLALVTTAGVAFSLYFLYVELVVIHALCIVCFTAYLFGWIAWAGSLLVLRKMQAANAAVATAPEPS
jgi:uncharacterized membrane protein